VSKTSTRPGPGRGRRQASPADPAVLSSRLDEAAAHFAAGRLDAAAQAYRAAERLAPDDIRAPFSLAVIDIRQGRLARAGERLEAVLALSPEHYPSWRNLAAVRQTQDRWHDAVDAYERALALEPDAADARQALAVALAIGGRTAEAVAENRRLAQDAGRRWPALTRIALLDPAAVSDDELAQMQTAALDNAGDEAVRAGLWFGLGEVLDRRGQAAESFEAFAAGNRLKRAALERATPVADIAAAHRAAADHVGERYTAAFLAANAGRGDASVQPIFIVGMPRSGSTLIEQILASHAGVQSLGEAAILPRLAVHDLPPGDEVAASRLRDMAKAYLAAARRAGWDGRRRILDKTLENYLHAGLIRLVFPRAAILHARRDPMDVCLSCFRQLFVSGNETLYDLADIGAEYRRCAHVMDHWRKVLPGGLVETDYETLVAEPEAQIRSLAEATGLSWDPAMLNFHARGGAVRTASAAQVRRPIHAGAVARWKAYADRLGPLVAALGPYGPS
jgi:tetratricopeptide (TPR) repeat protein